MVDLMLLVKKDNPFLDNYLLQTVLDDYGLENETPHRALSDAKATFELATRPIGNKALKI